MALRAWFEHLTAGGPRPPLPEGPRVALPGSAVAQPTAAGSTASADPRAASSGKAGAPLVLSALRQALARYTGA